MSNEYLKRTPTSTGNQRVWTWSGWVKINENAGYRFLFAGGSGSADRTQISSFGAIGGGIRFSNVLTTGNSDAYESTARRDYSGWMHIFAAVDTTLSKDEDRIKVFVNGIRIVNVGTTYPVINQLLAVNQTAGHYIGREVHTTNPLNANIADYFFIDGQALTPDVFGFYKPGKGYISVGSTQSTDFRPGQWVPKTPRVIKTAINNSGGFGVNGFYLPMNDSNNFGADFHCDPNSIIKLQENLPQPRCRIDGVGDYTGALRDDPFKQYLVLALPFVSGGLQNGFGDYSAAIKGSGSAKAGTVNGSISIASTASYYGSAFYTPGTSNYLSFVDSSDFDIGLSNQPFTWETWFNLTTTSTSTTLGVSRGGGLAGWNGTNGHQYLSFYYSANNRLYFQYWTGSTLVSLTSPASIITANQWNHMAVVYDTKSNLTMYVNGVAVAIQASTTFGKPSSSNITRVGVNAANDTVAAGYQQDVRLYKGVAKYTGGFDVPRPYTPVGIATWRAVPDTTANNFCTWNPLVPSVFSSGDRSISNGNLTVTTISTGNGTNARSTIGMSSGKWYAETYVNGIYGFLSVKGIGRGDNQLVGIGGDAIHYWAQTGNKYDYTDGSETISSYGSTYTTGDIIGISINGDNGEVIFYKNGVSQGIAKTFPSSQYPLFFQMEDGASAATVTYNMNFGQNPTFSGNTTTGTFTDSNGKGLFKYQPPSGFLALCEDNLPTPAIANPGRHFRTVLYTGDGNSGRSIVGVGFTPDLVWIKSRTNTNFHNIADSVRGAGQILYSNSTSTEENNLQILSSFNGDGFGIGNDNSSNQGSQNFVAWCWKAGAGTTSTNTNGSITSVVSVNQDAGFSIVSWTASGATSTIGHGLGKVPKFIIAKSRTSSGYGWTNYHTSLGKDAYIMLHSTDASASSSNYWGTSSPSTTVFGVAPFAYNNNSGNMIAYCWAEIEGYSKFGSYVGNGSADGPFIYTGGRPAFVMIKRTDSTANWFIFDNSRNSTNPNLAYLVPNATDIESSSGGDMDFLSNGFKIRNTSASLNASGGTYIFACWMESPFQTANSK